jgi:hypothetical protein
MTDHKEIADALQTWLESQNLKPGECVAAMTIVIGNLCAIRARSVIDLLEGLNNVHALVDCAAFERLAALNKLRIEED